MKLVLIKVDEADFERLQEWADCSQVEVSEVVKELLDAYEWAQYVTPHATEKAQAKAAKAAPRKIIISTSLPSSSSE
jgi:hypothetical protein